jgi:hypothetical protein
MSDGEKLGTHWTARLMHFFDWLFGYRRIVMLNSLAMGGLVHVYLWDRGSKNVMASIAMKPQDAKVFFLNLETEIDRAEIFHGGNRQSATTQQEGEAATSGGTELRQ